ncbi:TPA: hemolysin III, partial [Candidatus Acetothermia bacterium]|nr:hemolysin III [Candidatus Acetothermia bacterium]
MKRELPEYAAGEEIANAITHAVGTGLSIAGLAALTALGVLRGGNAGQIASLVVYGTTLVLTYVSSTLYHSFRGRRVKAVLRVLDHR